MKSNSRTGEKKQVVSSGISQEGLQKLLEDGLKDLYWAEKALVKAIPKMIENASSQELVTALEKHLGETESQVVRLEQAFEAIGVKPAAKKCDAMEGLIKEAEGIMKESENGLMMDAGIIAAAQKVEHYEIASYGTMAAYADILGHSKAATLLLETLEEEKKADESLTEVTTHVVLLENS